MNIYDIEEGYTDFLKHVTDGVQSHMRYIPCVNSVCSERKACVSGVIYSGDICSGGMVGASHILLRPKLWAVHPPLWLVLHSVFRVCLLSYDDYVSIMFELYEHYV